MDSNVSFKKTSAFRQAASMMRADARRMVRSKLFYIVLACALIIPILMTVMMTMMDGSVSVDPNTGVETVIKGPENAWQSIGNIPGVGETMGGMDVMSMCNINMMFMGVAVFICLFISDDFRSGYAKNIFTVRAKRGSYIISKTVMGFICGALMLIAYFIGAMIGGALSGLSFSLYSMSGFNIAMCMISKIFLMLVFVSIDVIISVIAKQRAWLCLCGSLGVGMILFMMVSMITPLSSTMINVAFCFIGGAIFAFGLGVLSRSVLCKTRIV